MSQFLGNIAGMLAIIAIGGGLALLGSGTREPPARPAKLARVGGLFLIVGGLIVGICTIYYWFLYQSQGAFQAASDCRVLLEGVMPHMKPGATTPPLQ